MNEQGSGTSDQGSDPDNDTRVPQVPGFFRLGKDRDRSLARHFLGPLIICFAALVATTPDLIRGNSCGHDFDFHLASWIDATAAWRQGIIYPHWAASPNWGAGEPRFVF